MTLKNMGLKKLLEQNEEQRGKNKNNDSRILTTNILLEFVVPTRNTKKPAYKPCKSKETYMTRTLLRQREASCLSQVISSPFFRRG